MDLSDTAVLELFRSVGQELGKPDLERIYARDDESDFEECPDELVRAFLDGLILNRRGPKFDAPAAANLPPPRRGALSNNEILKAVRIALSLTTEDIASVMALAGVKVSESELGALFRKSDHPKYKPCGDQFLRNFLAGLTMKYRG